ncbi:hypothetical protein E2C01_002818 [Portunus trituberculatus]|uniref:Uncharacterized protein n=1 Tax=Portunus trituberculatus TaxID=210409 RepID=A0A5B7CP75_PORTR|nr:hypothetical protein [Portunus trituberculatus]
MPSAEQQHRYGCPVQALDLTQFMFMVIPQEEFPRLPTHGHDPLAGVPHHGALLGRFRRSHSTTIAPPQHRNHLILATLTTCQPNTADPRHTNQECDAG